MKWVKNLDKTITKLDLDLKQETSKRNQYMHELRDISNTLTTLGGAIPNWTKDPELLAFWGEITTKSSSQL